MIIMKTTVTTDSKEGLEDLEALRTAELMPTEKRGQIIRSQYSA